MALPDPHGSSRSEPAPRPERTNLPVPVPAPPMRAPGMGRDIVAGWFGRMLRAVFGWKPGSLRADLEIVLEAGAASETGFSPEERAMLKNILGLRERRLEDVMVPRADIVAVHQDMPLGELLKVFEGAAHSRLVAYNDTLDEPVGMVHIRDLIAFMVQRAAVDPQTSTKRKKALPAGLDLRAVDLARTLSSTGIIRKILFVPPSMPAIDLLAKMQATRVHLALVIDEYGGTDGLVSIEDIVEQIVGDIEDEHDEDNSRDVITLPDGSFLADARANLEDVTATIGPDFDVGPIADEVDTLAGYLVVQIGRVPVRGELIPGPRGFEIEVLDADPRRVKKVRIYRGKDRQARRDRALKRRDGRGEADSLPPGPTPGSPTGESSQHRSDPSSPPSDTNPSS